MKDEKENPINDKEVVKSIHHSSHLLSVDRRTIMLSATVFLIIAIFSGAVFGAITGFVVSKVVSKSNSGATSQTVEPVKLVDEESAVTALVKKANPAVVSVIISQTLSQMQQNYFGFPFNNNSQQNSSGSATQEVGSGSGFIISSDGLILTSRHVVSDANSSYTVVLNDGTQYPATVVGLDPTNDIALIKINKTGLPTLPLGSSSNLVLGQTVIAIGNALGQYQNTVDKGIVSGLNRTVSASDPSSGATEQLSGMVQTDASINSGNSGGPLLNIEGQAVGINTAVASDANSVGFAIPIDQAILDVTSYQKNGKIVKPELGVRAVSINATIQSQYHLAYNYGAWVTSGGDTTNPAVVPNSPAAIAGLVENDIILEVNGTKVDTTNTLPILIGKYNVGDTVTLQVYHSGKVETISVKLSQFSS